MTKTNSAIKVFSGMFLVALVAAGCSPDTELGGTPVPNLPPNTELTASPPDLLEGSFIVSFNWTGFDPDGRIRGFQWKMSNNGIDGISVQDTLTFDPVTGAVLNPWHFSASTDTTLLVSADLPNFPRDPEGYNRSYQTHSFFVRAIDENGVVDPTPAYVSFNATTLLPTVRVTGPDAVAGQQSPSTLPAAVTFLYSGADPDFSLGLPTKVRFLWKRAVMPSGDYADSRIEVAENMDFMVDFGDSTPPWSAWRPFPHEEANRRVTFANQQKLDEFGRQIHYVFAIQVQDTTGAVSVGRDYGFTVMHVSISDKYPTLTVFENYLGSKVVNGANNYELVDIASGQELNFSWGATASDYAGVIETYRYGWDVADPGDPLDPGWAIAAGNTSQHRRAPVTAFNSGVHTLTVETRDNSGQISRIIYRLTVVQAPPLENQLPLLMIDSIHDRQSNFWVGRPPANTPYDNDRYRDAFWEGVLYGAGGVDNWSGAGGTGRDWIDTEVDRLNYRTIVRYRSLIWNSRHTAEGFIRLNLATIIDNRSVSPRYVDPYNWLAAYQEKIGNVLFCSSQAMRQFLPTLYPLALPVVFQSREGAVDRLGLQDEVLVGFGRRTQPDGSTVWVGETRYPYQTWGISVIDHVAPRSGVDVLYGSSPQITAQAARRSACGGTKALLLDSEFAARHMPGGAAFASAIFTEPLIDWQDESQSFYDNLTSSWVWGDDEFYDQVIADRTTHWDRQQCDNSPVQEQRCLEPMFYAYARFDWIRNKHLTKPARQNSSPPAGQINDNDPAGALLTFNSLNHGTLDSLRLRVNITHPAISQLRLELTNPAGVTVVIKEAGTGSGANLVGWYPTDFTPANPLTPLYGGDVYGNWRLRIIDTQTGGRGSFGSTASPTALETWFDDPWPVGYYTQNLNQLCGRYALNQGATSARSHGVMIGLNSWKTAVDKPSQVGDILWGFDPYRFDHAQMKLAIRWVLGEHFNLFMRP